MWVVSYHIKCLRLCWRWALLLSAADECTAVHTRTILSQSMKLLLLLLEYLVRSKFEIITYLVPGACLIPMYEQQREYSSRASELSWSANWVYSLLFRLSWQIQDTSSSSLWHQISPQLECTNTALHPSRCSRSCMRGFVVTMMMHRYIAPGVPVLLENYY